jgi:hypothetical protein
MVIGGTELPLGSLMDVVLRGVWLKKATEWNSFSFVGEC